MACMLSAHRADHDDDFKVVVDGLPCDNSQAETILQK
jgi:hypothetical protein